MHAATITPTVFTDDLTNNGNCTLREAIKASNTRLAVDTCTAGSITNTIQLAAGVYHLTITGNGEDANATGDFDVTAGNLTIQGASETTTIISAGGASFNDRVIDIISPAFVVLSKLTIQGGYVTNDSGGGISCDGTMTLTHVIVTGNTASGFSGGGGIELFGTTASTIADSWVADNTSALAGGIEVDNGALTITRSTISGNTGDAVFGVGGIVNFVTTNILDSTIANNISGIDSGGIYNAGGMNLTNVTIVHNSATAGGGGITNDGGTVNIKNSIIAYNIDFSNTAPDCNGDPFNSLGYNIVQQGKGCTFSGVQTGNKYSTDPLLSSTFATNSGSTKNYLPLSTSPAIDAGTNTGCSILDQRGLTRPQIGISGHSAICDIGADEVDYAPPVLTTVTSTTTAYMKSSGIGLFVFQSSEGGTAAAQGSCVLTSATTIDSITKTITASTVNVPLTEGVHTCTITATDASGNASAIGYDFTVDNTPPSLLVVGPKAVYIKRGQTYLDGGAMAFDPLDPFVALKIRTTSNVNTLVSGSYIVTYNATDTTGNDSKKYTGTGPYGQVYRVVYVQPTIDPVTMNGRSIKLGTKTIVPFQGYSGPIFARKVTYAKNDATFVFITAGATSRGSIRAFDQSGKELLYSTPTNISGKLPQISLSSSITSGGINVDIAPNSYGEVTLLLTPKSGQVIPMVMNINRSYVMQYAVSGTPSSGSRGNVIGKLVRPTDASPFMVIAGIQNTPSSFRLFARKDAVGYYSYQPTANLKPYGFAQGLFTNSAPQINKIFYGPIKDNGMITMSWQTDQSVVSTVAVGSKKYTVTALSGLTNIEVPAVEKQTITAVLSSCRIGLPAAQGCTTLGPRNFLPLQ